MNFKKVALTLSGIATIAGMTYFVAGPALAYRGDPSVQGPNCTPERHEEMLNAFNSNDYNAWKGLMQGKGRVTEVVNEENFARFAEAHQLALEGKIDEAKQIKQELGLGMGSGARNGKGGGRWAE